MEAYLLSWPGFHLANSTALDCATCNAWSVSDGPSLGELLDLIAVTDRCAASYASSLIASIGLAAAALSAG